MTDVLTPAYPAVVTTTNVRPPDRPMVTNPSHQPHECCGRIFQDKAAFDAHFASVHQPYTFDGAGNRFDNPEYVALGAVVADTDAKSRADSAKVVTSHSALPLAEHRVGNYGETGHSTGLAATEKHIPRPTSGDYSTGAEQVDAICTRAGCGKAKSAHRAGQFCNATGTEAFEAPVVKPLVAGPLATAHREYLARVDALPPKEDARRNLIVSPAVVADQVGGDPRVVSPTSSAARDKAYADAEARRLAAQR
jgi:hypothetical protein